MLPVYSDIFADAVSEGREFIAAGMLPEEFGGDVRGLVDRLCTRLELAAEILNDRET